MHSVNDVLVEWLAGWAGPSFPRKMAAGGFALKCGTEFAPRTSILFARKDVSAHFPLLATEWVAMALDAAEMWKASEAKASLKCALARQVPAEMVYRPKSAFVDPEARIFFDPVFIGYLKSAIESDGPIASMLDTKRVSQVCGVLEQGHRPAQSILRCLWAIVFLDRWYRTAQ